LPLPSVLAVWARAVSRWPRRSSRSALTAAASRRDYASPRRVAAAAGGAARPGHEVLNNYTEVKAVTTKL
jgi:hypothetical protein